MISLILHNLIKSQTSFLTCYWACNIRASIKQTKKIYIHFHKRGDLPSFYIFGAKHAAKGNDANSESRSKFCRRSL